MATLRNDSKRSYTLPKRGEGDAVFGGPGVVLGPGQTMEVPEAYAVALRAEPGLKHLIVSAPVAPAARKAEKGAAS